MWSLGIRLSSWRRTVSCGLRHSARRELESLESRHLLAGDLLAIRDMYAGSAQASMTVDAQSGVLANDEYDGADALQAVLVDPPEFGELSLAADGSFVYQAFGNLAGEDRFTYRAVAGELQSSVVSVTLELTAQPNVPVARADTYRVAEDQMLVADTTPMASVQVLDFSATQLVYDPYGERIYALAGNNLVTINPDTGEIGASTRIGGSPSWMVISDDGNYIYAVTNSTRSIRRFNTQTNTVDLQWDVADILDNGQGVRDIEPVPGRPTAVAVQHYSLCCNHHTGIVVVDNGQPLPDRTINSHGNGWGGDSITFVEGTTLVGYTNFHSAFDLTEMRVDETGIHTLRTGLHGLLSGYNLGIVGSGGYIYSDHGTVINAQTMRVVHQMPIRGALLPDNERVFLLHGENATTTLTWYTPTGDRLGRIFLPEIRGTGTNLVKVGEDRVAFRTSENKVVLVRNDLISGVTRKGVITNDSDPEGQSLTATLVSDVQHGQLTWAGDGTFTYQPNPNFVGTDTFTYRVSDGTHTSNVAVATIEVQAVNDVPVSQSDSYSTDEDVALTVDAARGLLANDSDVEGDALTAEVVRQPNHGTVTIHPDGSFTYLPSNDFAGTDTFHYRSFDGTAYSAETEVVIEVRLLDEPPVAVDDEYVVNEDGVLRVDGSPYLNLITIEQPASDLVYDELGNRLLVSVPTGQDTFANQVLTVDAYTGARLGTLAIGPDPSELVVSHDGRYLYTVIQDRRGVQVYDLQQNELGEKFFMPGTGDGTERVRTLHAIPGRPDEILLTRYYAAYSPSAGGTWVYKKDGTILPRHHGEGVGTGGPDITTVDETGQFAYGYNNSSTAFDFDEYTLSSTGVRHAQSYPWGSVLSGFNIGRIAAAGGYLFTDRGDIIDLATKQPAGNFPGGPNFLIDLDARQLLSVATNNQQTTLYIRDLDTLEELRSVDIPGTWGDTASLVRFGDDGIAFRTTDRERVTTIALVQSDSVSGITPNGVRDNDRDALDPGVAAELVTNVTSGQLDFRPDGSFVYRPNPEFSGTDQFQYRLTKGGYVSEVATVTLEVRPVNDPPRAGADRYATPEDTPLTVTPASGLLGNDFDPEGQSLTAALVTPPAHGTVEIAADGSFVYRPGPDYFGSDRFTYRVSDGQTFSPAASVELTVHAQPDPTVAQNDVYFVDQGRLLEAESAVSVPTESTPITLVPDDAIWHYLDDGSDQGSAWKELAYDDSNWKSGPAELGYGDGDEATVVGFGPDTLNRYVTTYFRHTFDVDNIESLRNVQFDVRYDDGVAAYLNGVEIARMNLAEGAAYDTLATSTPFDGNRYFPFPFDEDLLRPGVNVLAVEIHQATRSSSDITMAARVTGTLEPSQVLAGVLANDRDPDARPLTAQIVSPPEHGQLTLHPNGTFSYLPDITFSGIDQFQYSAGDDYGPSSTANVMIQVRPANVPPQVQADDYRMRFGERLVVDAAAGVLANDVDLEQMPMTVRVVQAPSAGTLDMQLDGSFTFTPNADFRLHDRFVYVASDGVLESAPVEVTIRVDAPVVTVGQFSLRPNTPNQQVPIYVSGGQAISGLNLYVQVGDGGPERVDLGLPAGTDAPSITGIDLTSGTIFAGVPDAPFVDLALPQVGFASLAIVEPNTSVTADGLLATVTIDTTGFFDGSFDLQLSPVLPDGPEGGLHTDFGAVPASVVNGRIHVVGGQVVGRHVFYNGSKYDGGNVAANADDDAAIAVDKVALLPGQRATFANYTSYGLGMNGVMVDVAGALGTLSRDDFVFRVGNSNLTGSWQPAPEPASVTVRQGAGIDGSDRVTIIWQNRAIANRWLEVTLLANDDTALPRNDVFYFGNAIGETGNDAGNALVNATDILAARDNPRGPFQMADISNPFDFNRDRLVTATDVILARDNITSPLSALRLITPTGSVPATAAITAANRLERRLVTLLSAAVDHEELATLDRRIRDQILAEVDAVWASPFLEQESSSHELPSRTARRAFLA